MRKATIPLIASLPLITGLSLATTNIMAADNFQSKVTQNVSDSAITTKIKAEMTANKILNPLDVSVSTHNGVVSLKGTVDSDTEYEQAISIAQSVSGVKDINADKLEVKDSKSPLNDLAITAKIKGKLMRTEIFSNKKIAFWGVSIETKDQVVYLTGTAKSRAEVNNIIRIAKSVEGVKSVESTVKVSS